jgi:hypothetical protein
MLKSEVESMKSAVAAAEQPAKAPPIAGSDLETRLGELSGLVRDMLDDAEESVANHPVATVAGALALGIVIGRLTAR